MLRVHDLYLPSVYQKPLLRTGNLFHHATRARKKNTFFGLGLAVIAASVNAMDYEVASCAELRDIDDTTVTSLTITSTPFECNSYTRFPVRNDMVLKSDSPVEFSNFALKVLGSLTVEPAVTFQDVTEQVSANSLFLIGQLETIVLAVGTR